MVNTKFWSDNFIRESLNPLDRYLFLYFLTNEKTNISGIYELPLSIISSETGIERAMLTKMMKRLKEKVYYYKGWVILKNFIKYQNTKSEDVKEGIDNALKEVPEEIKLKIDSLRWSIDGLGMVGRQPEELNLTKPEPNLTKLKEDVAVATPYSFKDYLEEMQKDEDRHIQVAALYWKIKGWRFENIKQAQAAIKRELRPAKALAGYTDQEIIKTAEYIDSLKDMPKWTLETIFKYIDDIRAGKY